MKVSTCARRPTRSAKLLLQAEEAYYAKYQKQQSTTETQFPKPLFIVPLPERFSPAEAQPLHMECHVEPKDDPKLRVEWFFNGKQLDYGSRFRFHISVPERDQPARR